MFYEAIKEPLARLLRIPREPPQPPLGSPGSERVFRAAPRYLTLELLLLFGSLGSALAFELIGWALTPVPAGTVLFAVTSAFVVVATALLMVVRYFLIRLDYDLRHYVITNRSLRIRRGAWTVEESTYTFANVQNLTLRQGPLERLLGITHLQIDTAGGGTHKGSTESGEGMHHQGRIDGIDPETARALREQILTLVRGYADAGLGDDPGGSAPRRIRPSTVERARCEVLRAIIEELRQIPSLQGPVLPLPSPPSSAPVSDAS